MKLVIFLGFFSIAAAAPYYYADPQENSIYGNYYDASESTSDHLHLGYMNDKSIYLLMDPHVYDLSKDDEVFNSYYHRSDSDFDAYNYYRDFDSDEDSSEEDDSVEDDSDSSSSEED